MNRPADDEAGTRAARLRAARDLVGQVLGSHREARSLLSEASHRRVLAQQSAAATADAAAAADTARVRYEELRHRVDPRAERPLPGWAAMALVAPIGAGLAGLAWVELAALPGHGAAAAAVAATWIAGAWLAATARRVRYARSAAAAWAGAGGLAALLAALHTVAAPSWGAALAGVLWALLSGALAVAAATLVRRAEPAALTQARRRWQRATDREAAAARTSVADAQAAATARESWLSLVRGVAAQHGDEQLTRSAADVAAGMI